MKLKKFPRTNEVEKVPPPSPGEPYCKIPIKSLKLLNKFLGTAINNSKIEFCKIEDKFLLSVDKEHYRIDIRLSTKFDKWNKMSPNGEILQCSKVSF